LENYKYLLFACLFSATVSWLLIPVLLHLAPWLRKQQLSLRDINQNNIPRLGGVAILIGILLAFLLFDWLPLEERGVEWVSIADLNYHIILFYGFLAWLLGFIDDLINLNFKWKLSGQIVLAILTVIFVNRIQSIDLPFFGIGVDLGIWSWPFSILWILLVMNSMNLVDGVDGLAGGIGITSIVFLCIFSFLNSQIYLALFLMMVLGATLGFWVYNKPPAKIFLGDSGAYLLGYLLAVLSLEASVNKRDDLTLAPLILLALPLMETLLTIVRRFLKGIPFYSADRDHIHHRLLRKGYSPTKTICVLISISFGYGIFSSLLHFFPKFQGFVLIGVAAFSYCILNILEYDFIKSPLHSVQSQTKYRSHRALVEALTDDIDNFFSKDPDNDCVIRSFQYWANLIEIYYVGVLLEGSLLWKQGEIDKSHHLMLYQDRICEIRITIPEDCWNTDTEVKLALLDRVVNSLMIRLNELALKSNKTQ
jgi:UDP-GlcNAc:undecaprenyl-phosphate/decaprenyl-phosphate GlcNAc-1-phosphate transferase